MTESQHNWAANYTYTAAHLHTPQSIDQLQALIAGSPKVKVLGTRHSFNHIADTPGDQISLAHFNKIVSLDRARSTVTVEAGVRYGELCQYLYQHGYALHNMASLPHISVAGACATATHGSGEKNGNLATAVTAMELITANGERIQLSREQDGEVFNGAVVGLGGLGVVTQLTLLVQPSFEMRQDIYENLPLTQLEAHFDAIEASAYSVSLFTDWQGDVINQIWLKRRVGGQALELAPDLFGALPATADLHPIRNISAENCTGQMGIAGPWHERLPHFRMAFTPSSGEELQSEYFVPRSEAVAALMTLNELRDRIAPLIQISEIRTIAADNLWMSPCYQQDSVALHFTWKKNWPEVAALLPLIEECLMPFRPRPHWGKLFTMPPAQLQAQYEKLPDFRRLLEHYDPNGKFRNAFLDTYIY